MPKIILKIKSLQVNKEIEIDQDVCLISDTLKKLDVSFKTENNHLAINQEEQVKVQLFANLRFKSSFKGLFLCL